jgi:hypothetical protein
LLLVLVKVLVKLSLKLAVLGTLLCFTIASGLARCWWTLFFEELPCVWRRLRLRLLAVAADVLFSCGCH